MANRVIRRQKSWSRRAPAILSAILLVPAFVLATAPQPAFALGTPTATFNVAAAKNGTALVLTVVTSNDANCVTLTGAHAGQQTSPPVPKNTTTWTFNFTAGTGNGTQTVTATAFTSASCTGTSKSTTASYVLDNTAPTISGAATPAPNSNGWNNTNVAVNFACADTGGSGIASCTPTTTRSSDGTNQSATGTAVDNAGNTASTTVSGINIDKTAPTLAGAPTTSPNGNGWYNGDVTIHWSCSDALSGIVPGSCPNNNTITGEGSGLTRSASVNDRAANTTSATSSPAVNIDRTAPVTTAGALPVWNNSNVTVTLSASDALSGVAATHWSLDGGATQTGTSVPVSTEGDHVLSYWSVDKADNTETAHTIHVRIDKTPPTISDSESPLPNVNGWNNTSVTVTFTCGDTTSGVASCTSPQTITTEGQNQGVTGTAVDNAGNSATDPVHVSIDTTKPVITGSPDRSPNGSGWYNANVTVSFACTDAVSGIDTCTTPVTIGEGANQSAKGTAVDAAGNSSSVTVSGINVDTTPPSISGAATTSPNANGWYSGDVTIHWTCSDNLSGAVNCPPDSKITGSGANLTVAGAVSDAAGNTTIAMSAPVSIDRSPPTTTSDAPAGWQTNDVTVHLSALDDFSGVDATHYSLNGGATQTGSSVVVSTQGVTTIGFWSVDRAGNAELPHFAEIRIDKSAPTIAHTLTPAPNGAGWNNAPVTVAFQCADAVSGIASCTNDHTLTQDGANQTVPGTAVDNAGNTASDSATVNIDQTPPTISGHADRVPNANGWYNADVGVSFACGDALSGVASCTAPSTLGEGASQSVAGSVSDKAGNSSATSVTGINVDETPPTISGAPTGAPNANGWYNGDVAVEWTCGDNLSGIDGACPSNSTITGEGTGLGTSASASDKAGNSSTGTVDHIDIDRTPPSTTTSAPSGWVNNDVTLSLHATDNLSGVDATYFSLDGGPIQSGNTVVIDSEGVHTLSYWSTDNAGNAETHHTVMVELDKTAPAITHSQAPSANGNGWNNSDVTVTFVCGDALSGVASCTGPQTATSEGEAQAIVGTAVDNAGNIANDTATVNIDKTPPTITGTPDRSANAHGWYNANVTVNFDCHDALSGVASCTGPVVFGEGANQSVTGSATDAADNSASAPVSGINVDTTPPTITGAATTSPNANGWYSGDVTIHWTCSDNLSGVDGPCPAESVITGEGANLSATATIADVAGNNTTATVDHINIDRTAPTTTSDAPAGWQNAGVVVNLTANDNLSGVAATHYILDDGPTETGVSVVVSGEGVHHLEFWSVDAAGNEESHHTATVKIDTTSPAIDHTQTPPPNGSGWNNSAVDIKFHCSDALSGVQSCSGDTTLTTEGASQSVTGVAIDNAGNSSTDTASVNIDTTPPTITSSRDAAPNGNDWYNSDVTVSFSCSDALSGVASCASPHHVGEGANQSVSGDAVDLAGNTATASDHDINVDTTPPTLTGAPTTAPNANGWYNNDVGVHWTCADNLSGIDEPCPSDSTITSEGADLSSSAAVADHAGNATTGTVKHVNIDRTPPSTSASAPSGWVNNDVTVSLSAIDNLSGVDATYFSLDGAPVQSGNSVVIGSEGVHTLSYWSTDKAGNEEPHSTISVLVDKTNPTISHTAAPAANANGWNKGDVTVTFTCSDALSGVAGCTGPQTITSEGTAQPVIGTAIDNAGNSATDTATVSIDKTPPTITGSADRSPNANGWYNANVTVGFECHDALSGVASCAAPVALEQGANQSAHGIAVDAADNTTSTTVSGINVDTTPPTISGVATTAPNANGWYNGDVTIHWTCNDELSGLDGTCPADSVISGEGVNLSASASVTDLAGNQATATVDHIKIDRTAPTTTADAPTGWQRTDVTVHFTANDNLAGVAETDYSVDGAPGQTGTSVAITANGTHHITFRSIDAAGNVESQRSATVQVDKLAPTLSGAATTAPNANGWYNQPVVVHFTCTDQAGLSGVASCTGDQTLSLSAAHQSVTGVATDVAGNTAQSTVNGINIDRIAPTVAVQGVADGATYTLGAVPTPSCSAVDSLSGPDGCSGSVGGGSAGSVGTHTYTATAYDKAGNSATLTVTYHVAYSFSGFLQPINDTAHQVGLQTSIFKAGSTVPVKFQLTRSDGTIVNATNSPQWLTPVKGSPLSAAIDQSVYGAVATGGTAYRTDTGQYIYNWSTQNLPAGYYYRIGVRLDDGSTYTVNIGLR